MSPFAADLSDAAMADLAAYYAAQTPQPGSGGPGDPARIAAGRLAAERHHCGACHGATYRGQQYAPRLAGQHHEYLREQLHAFKSQTRGELDGSMTTAAQPLTEDDIENVAQYIASVFRTEPPQAPASGSGGAAGQ